MQVLRRVDRADLDAGGGAAGWGRVAGGSGRAAHARNDHSGSIYHRRPLDKGGGRTLCAQRPRRVELHEPPGRASLVAAALVPSAPAAAESFDELQQSVISGRRRLAGTLTLPAGAGRYPTVLIIAGSGPTDRDGNNPLGIRADTYKELAWALAGRGVASLRYDKRYVGASNFPPLDETRLHFEDEVGDAVAWMHGLARDKRVGPITIAGHSQGSLTGMLAAERTRAVSVRVARRSGAGRGNDFARPNRSTLPGRDYDASSRERSAARRRRHVHRRSLRVADPFPSERAAVSHVVVRLRSLARNSGAALPGCNRAGNGRHASPPRRRARAQGGGALRRASSSFPG